MNPQYSFWADCLSKFQSASEPIQALWILALATTVLGVTWLATRAAVEIARIGQQARAFEAPTPLSGSIRAFHRIHRRCPNLIRAPPS